MPVRVVSGFLGGQKAHLRARAAKGAEVVGAVEALDGLGLEGDAFMPGFEGAFPVVEVIEVQAGVAEWRRYRRG